MDANGQDTRIRILREALTRRDPNYQMISALLTWNNEQEHQDLKIILLTNLDIIFEICKLGYLEPLEIILQLDVIDVNTKYNGKTCLQVACQYGFTDIVLLLLKYGATVINCVWDEESEFYTASYNGHLDVLNILLDKFYALIQERNISYTLFYAACCGGKLEVVHKWYFPTLNLNSVIEFVPSLNKCELMYPLYTACQGRFLDVAVFLIENGASITKEICDSFPEFTTFLIQTKFQTSNLRAKKEFDLEEKSLKGIIPCWFTSNLGISGEETDCPIEVDISINLSKNLLTDLPDGVLWSLQGLAVLKAQENPIKFICDALDMSVLASSRLTLLDLSRCQLEKVSSHIFYLPGLIELNLSHNNLVALGRDQDLSDAWSCKKLQILNVSHNQLTYIPPGIKICADMRTFNANHNQLTQSFPPWQCPMHDLDLSHNNLNTFLPSADQFWKWTLKWLKLDHNHMDELAESIVRLSSLIYLDVSHNLIRTLPAAPLWHCPISILNLSNNFLGLASQRSQLQRTVSCYPSVAGHVEFPGTQLSETLMELSLANNKFKEVPLGVCDLINLSLLDLSGNTELTSLPEELGKLKKISVLKLDGITVKDKKLQALIFDQDLLNKQEVISYLEYKLKNCVPSNTIKMVVLGCKNAGGQCIVQKLLTFKGASAESTFFEHGNMIVTQWDLLPNSSRFLSLLGQTQKRPLSFEIWEFPEINETQTLLPCFLTLNSLYIIVHDVASNGVNLQLVSEKILLIQACVHRPEIIIACLYPHTLNAEEIEEDFKREAQREHIKARYLFLNLEYSDMLDRLHQAIYEACENMKDSSFERDRTLSQRHVPFSFIKAAQRAKEMKKNKKMCSMEEFLNGIECTSTDLEDGVDANLKMHEFLLQVGAMLHYNIHRGELAKCVILNPAWLFHILSDFLKCVTRGVGGRITQSKSSIEVFKDILSRDVNEEYFPAFLHLLEAFNIAVRIEDANKQEKLLIPSLLSQQPPQIHLDPHPGGYRSMRLYRLSAIPSALWIHVISQLITAFERYSTSKWNIDDHLRASSFSQDRMKSFKMTCSTSLKGLHILNKNIQYWRTGIMINHDQGYVVVEEVECCTFDRDGKGEPGILVTVQTTGSNEVDCHIANLKKLSVIGIVRDELEEILEIYYPKFRDPTEAEMKPFALCQLCHNKVQPFSGSINVPELHFSVRDCAQMVLWKGFVTCSSGPSSLEQLVPEYLFFELPPELRLKSEDLELLETKLGHGMTGTVQKGKYRGTEVAVKIFHTPLRPVSFHTEYMYPNLSGMQGVATTRQEQDQNETEQRKISNAFSDVRREVSVLSKLNHKCIVAFIGVCVKPQLLIVMELAPLGSLRSALKDGYEPKPTDKTVSHMVFNKDLTYKMVFQIGCGLAYLHSSNIIYRDLKPDNILLMSLDVEAPINVKLSDYGISKFATAQGLSGLFGTPGYMAPEVMARQAYTNKVDIYSYAIVMLEILTGISPLSREQKPMISKMLRMASENTIPPQISGHKIQCNFPYLEFLMTECWSPNMDDRLTAQEIIKLLKADHFLLLHDCLWLNRHSVSCMYACETVGRWNIWICEMGHSEVRTFSVYDVESSCFTVKRWLSNGNKVISMTKVGTKIWLACQGQKNLETIGRGSQSNLELTPGLNLDAEPLKLFNHKFEIAETSECFILIGFSNGCLTAVHLSNPLQKMAVSTTYHIKLHDSCPVTDICSVNFTYIVATCGVKLHFLEAHPQQPCATQTIRPELIKSGSLCLQSTLRLNTYEPIKAIVMAQEAIWCSFEYNSLLVKVDAKLKQVVATFVLKWDRKRDLVKLEPDPNTLKPVPRIAISDSDVVPNVLRHSSNMDDVFPDPTQTNAESDENNSQSRTISHSLPDKPPPVPPMRGQPQNLLQSSSMPSLNPPPLPSSQEEILCVTSMILSADVLVLGTSCGGIVLFPLVNSFEDVLATHQSVQLPILRHPKERSEISIRPRTRTTNSSTIQNNITKSIPSMVLANEKLVSLHKVGTLVEFRPGRKLLKSPESDNEKRHGSIGEPNNTETFDSSRNTNINNDPVFEDNRARSASQCSQKSIISTMSEYEMSQHWGTADVAIWDKISWHRLNALRKYLKDVA